MVMAEEEPSWIDEILHYKRDGAILVDLMAARRVKHHQACYGIINDRLYCRSFSKPFLRCLTPQEVERVLIKMHKSICREHIGGQTLAFKVLQ